MIFLLAGTSDARQLGVKLREAGFALIASVVTDSAAQEWNKLQIPVHVGRLTSRAMSQFFQENKITAVVDASHPFAEEASKNAVEGARQCKLPYLRYERESLRPVHPAILYVNSYEEAAEAAAKESGTVFLTMGSKTLPMFAAKLLPLTHIRMVIRMLPRKDNMEICEELKIPQKDIVAMQGPFSKEFNRALFTLYETNVMITKESGSVGSFAEKVSAALDLGMKVIVIKRPQINYGTVYETFQPLIEHLHSLIQKGEGQSD